MFERLDVEGTVFLAEGHQVQRGQIAGRVVQEHILRAGVRRVDPPRLRAGVPLVDRAVELHARIGAGPGRVGDIVPQVARLDGLGHRSVNAVDQVPVASGLHRLDELVGHAHGIVGVLAGNCQVGFRIPVGIEGREIDRGIALAGIFDDLLNIGFRHRSLARPDHRRLQGAVFARVEAVVLGQRRGVRAVAGRHHLVQMIAAELRSRDKGGDLLLFDDFPVDVFRDVRMVDIHRHHLGGAAGRAAGLDGAGGAVADLQEAHQAGRPAAARQALAFAPKPREIAAGAGAVFEQARLAHPQIHDAALIDQIVADRLNEAGMGLRPLVGGGRTHHLAGLVIDIVMALARPVDAVGPVQAGIEPLRRIRRAHLGRQHVAHLVVVGVRVGFRIEIAAFPAPVGPGAGQPVEDLPGIGLRGAALAFRQPVQGLAVGFLAPQPFRHVLLGDRCQRRRDAGLAEIFLRQHVGRHLAPCRGHLDVVQTEHQRSVRVANLADGIAKVDIGIGRLSLNGESALDTHAALLSLAKHSGGRIAPAFRTFQTTEINPLRAKTPGELRNYPTFGIILTG